MKANREGLTSLWNCSWVAPAFAALAIGGCLLAGSVAAESTDAPVKQRPKRSNATRQEGFQNLLGDNAAELWRGYAKPGWPEGWEIVDGTLHGEGTGTDLITEAEYANFELVFDWKVAVGGNSGVMFRVSLGDQAPYYSGPEYQLLDDEAHSGGKIGPNSAGSLYDLFAPSAKAAKKAEEWNEGRIVVRGKQIRFFLNGKKVVQTKIGSPEWDAAVAKSKFKSWEKFAKNRSGHIALQSHGSDVWFRNLRIKTLPRRAGAALSQSDPGE